MFGQTKSGNFGGRSSVPGGGGNPLDFHALCQQQHPGAWQWQEAVSSDRAQSLAGEGATGHSVIAHPGSRA